MVNAVQAICWTLIHSLWQGLLLTIVAGTVMLLTKKASAAVRYAILVMLLAIFLLTVGYTFIHEWNSAYHTAGPLMAGTLPVIHVLQDYGFGHLPAAWIQYCSDHAVFIVTSWFILFSFRCWQMGRALLYVRRIRGSRSNDPGSYWNNQVNRLAQQLNIRKKVLLLESGVTRIPVVIGHLKPVIYMPLGLLANLPPEQVEAVLLHELAHIRRHDFLINLLQNIAETVFFFNPGLLWISSLLKQEREHCCDDMALRHTRKKKPFIEALISFREHAVYGTNYVIAFPGKKNQLLQRVTRIIQNRNNSLNVSEKIFFLFSFLVSAVWLIAAGNKQAPVNNTIMAQQQQVVATPAGSAHILLERKTATIQKSKQDISNKRNSTKRASIIPAPLPSMEQVSMQQALNDRQRAELDRQQADKDRAQAELDRKQAEKDRAQAELDRQQAIKDKIQADKDRAQAEIDRRQAEKDRQQAIKDREQFDRDRIAYAQKKAAH
jgi:beta-lactamase regulating signal transducer with metallopeptidase domain